MTLQLPGNPVDDWNIQQKFDAIALAFPDNRSVTATVTAAATVDIAIQSTDALAIIEFDLETTALCELRMFPNALGTAIYYYVSDGSDQTTVASAAVAANGIGVADANGARLALIPKIALAGGQQMTGRATFGSLSHSTALRTCIAQTAVASIPASANQLIELQNIASRVVTAAALTSLRFTCSAGTMTGRIRVTRG
jgi:hypothetical protein